MPGENCVDPVEGPTIISPSPFFAGRYSFQQSEHTTHPRPIEERSPPMSLNLPPVRIAVSGSEPASPQGARAWGIWPTGYPAAVTAAGAEPVPLEQLPRSGSWADRLAGLRGLVFA